MSDHPGPAFLPPADRPPLPPLLTGPSSMPAAPASGPAQGPTAARRGVAVTAVVAALVGGLGGAVGAQLARPSTSAVALPRVTSPAPATPPPWAGTAGPASSRCRYVPPVARARAPASSSTTAATSSPTPTSPDAVVIADAEGERRHADRDQGRTPSGSRRRGSRCGRRPGPNRAASGHGEAPVRRVPAERVGELTASSRVGSPDVDRRDAGVPSPSTSPRTGAAPPLPSCAVDATPSPEPSPSSTTPNATPSPTSWTGCRPG